MKCKISLDGFQKQRNLQNLHSTIIICRFTCCQHTLACLHTSLSLGSRFTYSSYCSKLVYSHNCFLNIPLVQVCWQHTSTCCTQIRKANHTELSARIVHFMDPWSPQCLRAARLTIRCTSATAICNAHHHLSITTLVWLAIPDTKTGTTTTFAVPKAYSQLQPSLLQSCKSTIL